MLQNNIFEISRSSAHLCALAPPGGPKWFFGDLEYFLLSFLDSDGDKENRKNGIGENE